jgi:hypothetical protein
MAEKSNLQILCEEKIPRVLIGESPEVVFGYAQSSSKCTSREEKYREIESEEAFEARL